MLNALVCSWKPTALKDSFDDPVSHELTKGLLIQDGPTYLGALLVSMKRNGLCIQIIEEPDDVGMNFHGEVEVPQAFRQQALESLVLMHEKFGKLYQEKIDEKPIKSTS